MFTLETIALDSGPTVAIAQDGQHIPLASAGARLGIPLADVSLFQLLQTWDDTWSAVTKIVELTKAKPDFAVQNARVLPQFERARKVMCAGANYYKHLEEMNVQFKKEPGKPVFFFLKPPTAIVGPGRTLPMDPTIQKLDWEVEATVIIGKTGRDIPVERALEHAAGYTIAVDMTARDRLMQPESIFKFDFVAGKGQDGFCPTSASFLPAAFFKTPEDAGLRLSVNGVMKQDARTSDMIYSIAECISWASRLVTLEPGDLVLTGSPAGVGMPKGEFLKIGDRIHAELDPLVKLDVEIFEKKN